MNTITPKKEITEADYEKMCHLAEDVMQELYMNFASYDEEGNDVFMKHRGENESGEEADYLSAREEHRSMFENPNGELLYNLFRRGDDIGDVRYYTLEDIRPWIEPIIPKALQMFRKGTNVCGETEYVAAPTVPDDYLIEAFAREVRNMMMIFAGQKLQRQGTCHHLLLLEDPACHDMDEWMGIYYDDENLKKAYEEVTAQLEKDREEDKNYRSLQVAIWEFRPNDEDIESKRKGETSEIPGQLIRKVNPEELRCFRERKDK